MPAYLAFSSEHWRRIRTNNPLERILRVISRRPRRRVVPGRTIGAQPRRWLRHIAGTAWSTKRYLNIEFLKDQQVEIPSPREPGPGAAHPTERLR
jgi:hypothetical protein